MYVKTTKKHVREFIKSEAFDVYDFCRKNSLFFNDFRATAFRVCMASISRQKVLKNALKEKGLKFTFLVKEQSQKICMVTDTQIIEAMTYLIKEERFNLDKQISLSLDNLSINEVSSHFCISELRVIKVYEEKLETTIQKPEWHLKNNIRIGKLLNNWFTGRQLNIENSKFIETLGLKVNDLENYWEQNLRKK